MISKKIFILVFTSFFYFNRAFSMDNPQDPSRLFFDKLRSLQISLTDSSGLLDHNNFSPAEVIILRLGKEEPTYYVIHVNYAFEYYIQKTIPTISDMPEISEMQIKIIKNEKAYYEYLRKKIYLNYPRGAFQNFKPTTEQLNKQIPNFHELGRLFQTFLNNNGLISRGKILTLKKWLVFDCCDQVFSSLGTRAGLNKIGEERKNLDFISQEALKEKPLGTWLCRPSVACPDDENKQTYCRTIIFKPRNASMDFNALRIIHVLGQGFFQVGDLDKPESWHPNSSLVEILQHCSKTALDLNKYLRVENNLYATGIKGQDQILDS